MFQELDLEKIGQLERRQPLANAVILIASLFLLFPLTVVTLRMYVRTRIVKKVGIDDYLVILATVLSIVVTIAIGYECKRGVLSHAGIQANLASILAYFTSVWALKMSVCCFCHKIFGRVISRRKNLLIWTAMALVTFIWVISFGTIIFSCSPISSLWNPRKLLTGEGCINIAAESLVLAIINAVSDWLIMYLPLILIKQSDLNSRQKKYISGILSLAFLATLGSISRVASYAIVVGGYKMKAADIWIMLPISTSFALNCAIVASSLPSLSPLFRSAAQRFGRSGRKNDEEPEFFQTVYFNDKGQDFGGGGFADWESDELEFGNGNGKGGGIMVETSYVVERTSPRFPVKVFSPRRWASRSERGSKALGLGSEGNVMKAQPALPVVKGLPVADQFTRMEARGPVIPGRSLSFLEVLRQGPPTGG